MKPGKLLFLLMLFMANVSATEISKEDWLNAMETALPAAFCNSQMYFRQCFKISAEECEEMAASTTRICLKKFQGQIPAVLKQPDDGGYWGEKVGECAGGAFDLSLNEKRIDSELCNDPSNWQ